MKERLYARKAIWPEMTVRQIAADFPASQEVFRKYGERACPPARFGHLEPLSRFADRRGVPLERLLSELATATGAPVDRLRRRAERVHRGFLLSALAVTLTFGAGWGAWLLWQIAAQGEFGGASVAHVIAHGEAQLWGFVTLFVMGISLRTVLQDALRLPLADWICGGWPILALAGVGGGILWSVFPQAFASIGLLSSVMLLLMSLLFWILQAVFLHAKWAATWARALLASGFWLTSWAALTVWLRYGVGPAGPGYYSDSERLLLIELAVFGFAMNSVYGFGQTLLPGLLRIGSTRRWALELSHWLHNAGVVALCIATGLSAEGPISAIASGLILAGAVLFAAGLRGFVGQRRTAHGDEKGHVSLDFYPPLAFLWLLIALILMACGVLYETVHDIRLPHAYTGAVRHALTVGFITTLILGVGQRMVPVLDRTVLAMPRLTVPILVLIGLGNLLRVGSELAIVISPAGFSVMPFSGILEWTALVLFSVNITRTMFHRDPLLRRGRVTKRSSLAVLLAEHPWIEDRLRPTGTRYLERARSVPKALTIASFAAHEGFDPTRFVAMINEWLAAGPLAENAGTVTNISQSNAREEFTQ